MMNMAGCGYVFTGTVTVRGVTITYDSNESLYGFGGELGAEAAAAKGEVSAAGVKIF